MVLTAGEVAEICVAATDRRIFTVLFPWKHWTAIHLHPFLRKQVDYVVNKNAKL